MSRDNGVLGARGEQIASKIFPSLRLVPSGARTDREGTDAWLDGIRVQIKTDQRIAATRLVFWEFWKRNGDWSSFGGREMEWRRSPCHAGLYIFITRGLGIKVPTTTLLHLAIGREFRLITATAAGVLIPLAAIQATATSECKPHGETL